VACLLQYGVKGLGAELAPADKRQKRRGMLDEGGAQVLDKKGKVQEEEFWAMNRAL
jgi:hypothetical protein